MAPEEGLLAPRLRLGAAGPRLVWEMVGLAAGLCLLPDVAT